VRVRARARRVRIGVADQVKKILGTEVVQQFPERRGLRPGTLDNWAVFAFLRRLKVVKFQR
jgi:hypothetical protein